MTGATLERRRVRLTLSWVYGLLGLIAVVLLGAEIQRGSPVPILGWLFHLNREQNIPTWASSIGLLFCAQLLAAIGLIKRRSGDRFAFQWLLMASIFVLLSMDEVSGVHEHLNKRLEIFQFSGMFHYAWVIPAAVFVAAFAAYYGRFLMSLAAAHRRRFILSGAIYVGGALGLEAAGGWIVSTLGYHTMEHEIAAHIEELLELAGIVCFADALIAYLADCAPKGVQLFIADDGRPTA